MLTQQNVVVVQSVELGLNNFVIECRKEVESVKVYCMYKTGFIKGIKWLACILKQNRGTKDPKGLEPLIYNFAYYENSIPLLQLSKAHRKLSHSTKTLSLIKLIN